MVSQRLDLSFTARGHDGSVRVLVRANTDPGAVGSPSWAADFPLCQAEVAFDGFGYEALFGWVQLVRMGTPGDPSSAVWVSDPLEVYDGLNTPFGFFGLKPQLFDAPARSDRSRNLDWHAESYLCFAPDAPMSRSVRPVASFSWGFVLSDGKIEITELRASSLTEWGKHRPLLASAHPTWTFQAV